MAVKVGAKAAWDEYKQSDISTSENLGWDTYAARRRRYALARAWYDTTIYDDIHTAAITYRKEQKLYRHIQDLHNPVSTLVELYVGMMYGGALNLRDLGRGALPLAIKNDALLAPARSVLMWSKMAQKKARFVRDGARFGDTFFNIVDDTARGQVRLDVVNPAWIREVELDADGVIQEAVFQYVRTDEVAFQPGLSDSEQVGDEWVYTLVVTPDSYSVFRDDEPADLLVGPNGVMTSEIINPYGFVPLVHIKHIDDGNQYGISSFHTAMVKINKANMTATLIADAILKSMDVVWAMWGVDSLDSLATDEQRADQLKVLFGPPDGKAQALVPPLDLIGAGTVLEKELAAIEKQLPELALGRIREQNVERLTQPGVVAASADAINKFETAQTQYDQGVTDALLMAFAIGGLRRYEGFTGMNLESRNKLVGDFFVKPREIFPEVLPKFDRITFLMGLNAPPDIILKEMNYSQAEIMAMLPDIVEATAQAQAVAAQIQSGNGNQPDGEDEDLEDDNTES